jgi:SpoVK/Ycf46/Vps4 family AAA+-type ATPase
MLTSQISAGQLSSDANRLDLQLVQIFKTASHWNALLLLDEADVFLTQRSCEHIERNRLVATFLHKLEYFEGVLFLTTNQPTGLDPAIRNRVHLTFDYPDLDCEARREIFHQFLQKNTKLQVDIDDQQLDSLAQVKLNGREVSEIHDRTTRL